MANASVDEIFSERDLPAALDALLDIDRLVVEVESPTELLKQVIDRLIEVRGVAGAAVWMPQAGTDAVLRLVHGSGRGVVGYLVGSEIRVDASPLGQGPGGQAWRARRVRVIADCRTAPEMMPWRDVVQASGLIAIASLPLMAGGAAQGILSLYSHTSGFFGTAFPPIWLDHLANVLGLALDHLQRRESEHTQQRRIQCVQALYRALLAEDELTLGGLDESHLLSEACRRLVASGLFHTAWIGRPMRHAGEFKGLRRLAASGVENPALLDIHLDLPHSGNEQNFPCQRAWRSGRAEIERNWPAGSISAPMRRLYDRYDWRMLIALPLRRGGKLWAVCEVVAGEEGEFSEEILHLLTRIASLIGHALDEIDLKHRLEDARRDALHLAHHDALTGLPNRLAIEEHLPHALARTDRNETLLGVGMLDLDDFKPINDKFGHEAGDELLKTLATRVRSALRETDYVARLGGDEFALVLEGIESWDSLERALARLQQAIEAPMALPDGTYVAMRASLGYTVYPLDEVEADTLLRHADLALYQVKADKSRRVAWHRHYEAAWDIRLTERLRQQHGVSGLIERGLEVHFQPVIDLRSGRITKLEALARLRNGSRLLSPIEFLGDLLPSELRRLSLAVCDRALEQSRAWSEIGLEVKVAVNFLPEHMMDPLLSREIGELLDRHGVAPGKLVLEVLEQGDFLSLASARERLLDFKALGVSLSLDDLGSAYASLLRLKELPFDEVKLDQAFIRGIGRRPRDLRFVVSVMTLARALDVDFVVEGVEDPEVLEALRILDVPAVQGFALSTAVSAADIPALLVRRWPTSLPLEIKPGHNLAAYAAMMQWSDVTIGMLELSPERLDAEVMGDYANCPMHAVFAHDELLDRLHREQHLLGAELARCTDRQGLAQGIRRLRKLSQDILYHIEAGISERT